MYSRIVLLMSTDTGFRSLANTSAPIRRDSSGIAPPPAKGSTTSGRPSESPPRLLCAEAVNALAVLRKAGWLAASAEEKSAMKSRRAFLSSDTSLSTAGSLRIRLNLAMLSVSVRSRCAEAHDAMRSFASSQKLDGHIGSAGSGHSVAQAIARHAAGGRAAG